MFALVNIFEVFLPQLLRYPNASDPLNADAASLLMDNEESYNCKVREYVKKYASAHQLQGVEQATTPPPGSGLETEEGEDLDEDEIGDDFDDGNSDVSEMSDL